MSTMEIKPQQDAIISYPRPHLPAANAQEIDLLTLAGTLWNARKRILSVVLCCALAGLVVSLFLPQKWTSSAVITPAENNQLVPLNQLLATVQVLGVDLNIDNTSLVNLFIKKFNSSVLLEEYFKSSSSLMNQFDGVEVDPVALHRAIVQVSERMKAMDDAANKKEPITPYHSWTLSFTGPQPEEAQAILAGYMQFVADKVVSQTMMSIHDAVKMKVQVGKQRLLLERAQLENTKEAKIKRLNYSLQVAKAAGINKPVYSNGQAIKDDPDFSVTLGTDGLNKKLKIEKSITDVSELNAGMLNREYLLKQLEDLNIKAIQFPVVNYQLSPSLPVKKDGPGKSMIVVLAVLVGGLLACGSVLLQQAVRSRRNLTSVGDASL